MTGSCRTDIEQNKKATQQIKDKDDSPAKTSNGNKEELKTKSEDNKGSSESENPTSAEDKKSHLTRADDKNISESKSPKDKGHVENKDSSKNKNSKFLDNMKESLRNFGLKGSDVRGKRPDGKGVSKSKSPKTVHDLTIASNSKRPETATKKSSGGSDDKHKSNSKMFVDMVRETQTSIEKQHDDSKNYRDLRPNVQILVGTSAGTMHCWPQECDLQLSPSPESKGDKLKNPFDPHDPFIRHHQDKDSKENGRSK